MAELRVYMKAPSAFARCPGAHSVAMELLLSLHEAAHTLRVEPDVLLGWEAR